MHESSFWSSFNRSAHTVRNSLDFGGRPDDLVWGQTALGVYQVGGEDGVDESRFAQSRLACFVSLVELKFERLEAA